ncbi:MAG TPA: hypothetical protein VIR63_00555 [Pontiella sp.]
MELFPRSSIPAWIFTALCCWLGGREAQAMNMGSVGVIKPYIPVMSAVVFFSSVVFMKELLAPRALGGFLLLIAVPIVRTASMSGAPAFQILVGLVYLWIILGIILLMSPWYFRKFYEPFLKNKRLLKMATLTKTALGIILLMLGIFVY